MMILGFQIQRRPLTMHNLVGEVKSCRLRQHRSPPRNIEPAPAILHQRRRPQLLQIHVARSAAAAEDHRTLHDLDRRPPAIVLSRIRGRAAGLLLPYLGNVILIKSCLNLGLPQSSARRAGRMARIPLESCGLGFFPAIRGLPRIEIGGVQETRLGVSLIQEVDLVLEHDVNVLIRVGGV